MNLIGCPFCGNTHNTGAVTNRQGYAIECWKCAARGPTAANTQKAHEAWVKRAAHPAESRLEALRGAVDGIMPFIDEDYRDGQGFMTVEYKGAIEALKKARNQ